MSAIYETLTHHLDTLIASGDYEEAESLLAGWTPHMLVTVRQDMGKAGRDLYARAMPLLAEYGRGGQRFAGILHETASRAAVDPQSMSFVGPLDLAPEWLAGIVSSRGEVRYRGLSILGGDTGTGKSKLATRAALLACANPKTAVIYLCAEIDEPTTALYAKQCTGIEPRELLDRFRNFYPVVVPAGCTYDRVVNAVVRRIPLGCERVVIVADTINTLVEKCQEDMNYFGLMRQFGIWMLESRVRSAGLISWLAVSELNADKQVLGVKLDKWADFVLRFKAGDFDNQVHIEVLKGRYSGREELGQYYLNWQTCEMEKV